MSFTEFKSKYEHVLNELAKIEISKNQESSRGNSYNDTEQQIKIIDEKDEIFQDINMRPVAENQFQPKP